MQLVRYCGYGCGDNCLIEGRNEQAQLSVNVSIIAILFFFFFSPLT